MKQQTVALADPPIAPICADDERPAVRDLIAKHRLVLDELAQELSTSDETKALFDKTKHDDLWILRFVLSHKGHYKQALHAAVHTLQFRAEHHLDDKDIRAFPPGPLAQDASFQKYFASIQDECFIFDIPHPQRGVVVFLMGTGFDQQDLQHLEYTDRVQAFCYISEWTHQWLDYVTRTTGRLTKSCRLLDVKGVGLKDANYETLRLEAKAIANMEDCYPQLLETFYIVNPPSWVAIPWKIMRPLLPSRVVHKIDFVAPGKSKKERQRLREFVQEKHLPVEYGGERVIFVQKEKSCK